MQSEKATVTSIIYRVVGCTTIYSTSSTDSLASVLNSHLLDTVGVGFELMQN